MPYYNSTSTLVTMRVKVTHDQQQAQWASTESRKETIGSQIVAKGFEDNLNHKFYSFKLLINNLSFIC